MRRRTRTKHNKLHNEVYRSSRRIRIRRPIFVRVCESTVAFDVHMDIMLDGHYIQAPFVARSEKDGRKGYVATQSVTFAHGQSFTQQFQFSKLRTGRSESTQRHTTMINNS